MVDPRIPVVCVHGTWGEDWDQSTANQWWEPGSAFLTMLESAGCDGCYFDPFVWSGQVAGASRLWPWNWFRTQEEAAWRAAARSFRYLLAPKHAPSAYRSRNVIAHSHGGQAIFYAASEGLLIRRLITVGTPVRDDLYGVIAAARPNIGFWLHLYHPGDRMQFGGGIGDGHFGIRRTFPQADDNQAMPGGHSGVLNDPALIPLWKARGWLATFEEDDDAQPAA
jgi:hypothetical protein